MKLIRSALFVPGNRPDRIDKAFNFNADIVIIDLEDSVPEDQKNETRNNLKSKLKIYKDRKYIIRVNSINTEFFKDDISELVLEGLFAFMIPKVDKADDIYQVIKTIKEKEKIKNWDKILIIPLIENALAVQNIFKIISNDSFKERLFTVAFGAADYCLDLNIALTKNGDELQYPRSRIAVACKAAGIASPLDTPYMIDLQDLEGLELDAKRARQLGFQGKLCIHPNQIEICNKIFSPTKNEIDFAKKALEVYKEAVAKGIGAIKLEGKFLDLPIIRYYEEILKIAGGNK
jgi:citrate lyase subunit beta / citryl-CoA lyase